MWPNPQFPTNQKDTKSLEDLILGHAPKSGLMTSLYAFYRSIGIFSRKANKKCVKCWISTLREVKFTILKNQRTVN